MKSILLICAALSMLISISSASAQSAGPDDRTYRIDRVGQSQIVQLYADGFEKLTLREKTFAYYMSLACIAGRDIAIDQHHPRALEVREVCQAIYTRRQNIDPVVAGALTEYLKLFWENNGFYDNLTSRKFVPACTFEQFVVATQAAVKAGVPIPLHGAPSLRKHLEDLEKVIFDPNFEPMLTNKTPGEDWIKGSAVNFYDHDLSYAEVEAWAKAGNEHYPLNSTVVREDGKIVEKVWRAGGQGYPPGLYAGQLSAVIGYLEKAIPFAASNHQAETIRLLIRYFQTGNNDDFRAFNIHWVKDTSRVDFIMGFIEVYLDPRGQKAEWEASVFFSDPEQTQMMQKLATFAQYFEEKAPWADAYKKKIDKSPIANVINVIIETGGTGPVTPIGINLPNEQAIREQYGSKSVLLHNVVEAYDKSTGKSLTKEFSWDQEEFDNQEQYGTCADNLHTAMHEVIGHGSGKASEKLGGKDPGDFLPGYYNTLEEARADLMALWNAWDPKLIDIGIAKDTAEARKIGETMFQQAIRVALTQLRRVGKSTQLEEDHLRDRALIANYILQDPGAARVEKRDGKTYYRIVDYERARQMAGKLLAELMRIKAEGDLPAAKAVIDKFASAIDTTLRDEVQERVSKLDAPSYTAFAMPRLTAHTDEHGAITDVVVTYDCDFPRQMFEYSRFTTTTQTGTR